MGNFDSSNGIKAINSALPEELSKGDNDYPKMLIIMIEIYHLYSILMKLLNSRNK